MGNPFLYFWRHPRRSGFIVFNIIVLALMVAWGAFTSQWATEGLAGIPNLMLGMTGMALLVVTWIVGWIAWGTMIAARHRPHG